MGLQATEYKVAYHDGDYKVAVQWYERLVEGGSSERREFKMGKPQIDVINSTELRAYGFHVDVLSVGPPLRPGARSAERAARLADAEEHRHWRLPLSTEAEADLVPVNRRSRRQRIFLLLHVYLL